MQHGGKVKPFGIHELIFTLPGCLMITLGLALHPENYVDRFMNANLLFMGLVFIFIEIGAAINKVADLVQKESVGAKMLCDYVKKHEATKSTDQPSVS